MMSKPPPIPPPPIAQREREREREFDASIRLYWMIAPAVLIGVLLAIFSLSWLVNRSDVGQGNDDSSSGAQTVAAGLDHENGTTSASSRVAGTQTYTRDTDSTITGEKTSDSPGRKDPNERNVPSSATEAATEEEVANNQETTLQIFEEKRTAKPSQSRARGANLADRSGANPFVGTGTAKSTVYVIDVSGSMQTSDRLPRVLSTLKRAVDLLKPDQKFTVILFDQGFYTDPIGMGLLLANEKNKQAIYDWLDSAPGGGGTNPLPAMFMAIQQKPERIVLLSDGEFDPSSVFAITQANHSNLKPAKIDCVGLMEEVETLKEIARLNKGIYYQAQ